MGLEQHSEIPIRMLTNRMFVFCYCAHQPPLHTECYVVLLKQPSSYVAYGANQPLLNLLLLWRLPTIGTQCYAVAMNSHHNKYCGANQPSLLPVMVLTPNYGTRVMVLGQHLKYIAIVLRRLSQQKPRKSQHSTRRK